MSVTRNYARHLRVITVLQTITLQLRIVTRKVRNYGVITHFTHLRRNAGSVTRNSHPLILLIHESARRLNLTHQSARRLNLIHQKVDSRLHWVD